jgi:hypothetical protein
MLTEVYFIFVDLASFSWCGILSLSTIALKLTCTNINVRPIARCLCVCLHKNWSRIVQPQWQMNRLKEVTRREWGPIFLSDGHILHSIKHRHWHRRTYSLLPRITFFHYLVVTKCVTADSLQYTPRSEALEGSCNTYWFRHSQTNPRSDTL